jgi:hypothetical protein
VVHSILPSKQKKPKKNIEKSEKNVVSDLAEIPLGTYMFVFSACIPFGAFAWAYIGHSMPENFKGILWTAAVSNALIAISTRVAEVSREIRGLRRNGDKSVGFSVSSASVCMMATVLSICWTVEASILSHSVSSDLTVPLACLLLITTRRNMMFPDIHPVALAAMAASSWWLMSALYSIFVKGFFHNNGFSHFELNVGIFGEENVSFWSNDSMFQPLLNLLLTLVPLPAIALGFIRRKGESEDMLFILALLSSLTVIGASSSSVRLLGVMGVAFGGWRCYDVGQKQGISNKLI